jgi:hypothetical protein
MALPKTVLLALLPFFIQGNAQSSGTGTTTRYWDCCKASCAWKGKITLASGSNPVTSCDAQDRPTSNYDAVSGCNNGATYMCSNQSPWAVSDSLSYGYAATTIAGGKESSWCCACYELTFTSGAVKGKKMVVQATNTGGDLSSNQFDLAVSWFPGLRDPANESRFRVVASGSSMGAAQNGEHLRLAGDSNTAASHLVPSAMPFQLP